MAPGSAAVFLCLEPKVIDYIDGDLVTWEQEPMQNLAREGNLFAFPHDGFWHAMDSLRDKNGAGGNVGDR